MFPWRWLALLALIPLSLGANAGMKVKLTQKGLDFGRELVVGTLQEKLKTLKVPDMSGSEHVDPIGTVHYSLTEMQIVNLGLPSSAMGLVPGTGVTLSIDKAFLSLHGKWRVKYLKFIKDSGTFDLSVTDLTITTSVSVRSDETGRPAVATVGCTSTLGGVNIKFHGGASWLYNLFTHFIEKGLRSSLQNQICPLVGGSVSSMNQYLKSLKVLAPVDKHAEIAYSMVSSPEISNSSIGFNLKGEFYNIGNHTEPPYSPEPFFIPDVGQGMLCIGISAFTANSGSYVYHKAGAMSVNITDDMIPPSSPFRLNTKSFEVFIPQIAKMFPNMKMELQVETLKDPLINIGENNMTLGSSSTLTAYAILANASLAPLFVLNVDASVGAQVTVVGNKVAGAVALNELDMSLGKSYVGDFQVRAIQNIFQLILKVAVLPSVNERLKEGYPLPTMGKINLVNTKLQVLKGYILIGTDFKMSA